MSVGLSPDKLAIDTMAGTVARDVQSALVRARQFRYFLDGKVDADLSALGYSPADIATLRSAYLDLDALVAIYNGEQGAILAAPKDFRTFSRRIFGLGNL